MSDVWKNRVKVGTTSSGKQHVTFRLRDYLSPGGLYRYEDLAPDMEAALGAGNVVYLYSVPGFMMVAGHPNDDGDKPWHVTDGGDEYFDTAADAIKF